MTSRIVSGGLDAFNVCLERLDLAQRHDIPSCRDILGANAAPLDRLQRLLEVVRTLAVPARVVH